MQNPILRSVPESVETPRLLLRCARPGDAALIFPAVLETLQDLRRFPASMPWALEEPTLIYLEGICRMSQINYLARSEFWYLMMDKQRGSCAGAINLHSIQWNVPKFEIGFWCRKSRQGEGLASEAVRELSRFALKSFGANRLEALPDEENTASRRVCEQAGYVLEGIRRHDRIEPGGALRNSCMYALVR